MKRLLCVLAGGSLALAGVLPPTARAQEATPPPLEPIATPPPATPAPTPAATPAVSEDPVPATPAPTPRLARKPRATPAPTPFPDEPVAVVNGATVYPPLLPSAVPDPVERALVLQDFQRRKFVVPASVIDNAAKDYARRSFKGSQAVLTARLQALGASQDDYRRFITEEVRLQAMLSEASRQQSRPAYLAGLRRAASVNKAKP